MTHEGLAFYPRMEGGGGGRPLSWSLLAVGASSSSGNFEAKARYFASLFLSFSQFIFIGPLLYHFADMANEWSVELSYEEIRRIATEHFKFEIIVCYYHACTVP